MPTAIEKIQAKAKALRKSYPKAKWTDLIKKASTELKKVGAIGGVSKKKKATKKAATKKTVSKRKPKVVKVLKQHGTSARAYDKRHQALPAGRRISKSGRPYTETRSNRSDKGVLLGIPKSTHKDTKSHNVNIRVMSGVNKEYLADLNKWVKLLDNKTFLLNVANHNLKKAIKEKDTFYAGVRKREIALYKKQIATIKKHIASIKKYIK